MKKIIAISLLCFLLCGCSTGVTNPTQLPTQNQTQGTLDPTESVNPSIDNTTPGITQGVTQDVTQGVTQGVTQAPNQSTQPGTSNGTTAAPVNTTRPSGSDPTPEPTEQFEIIGPAAGSVDIYGLNDSTNLLIGMDQFGRTFDVQYGHNGRDVGMFFHLWHGAHGKYGVYDSSKILAELGGEALFWSDSPQSPSTQFHYWSEPLYGYYDSGDEWVIRKQMELMCNAGLDFIAFDVTNGDSRAYKDNYMKVLKVLDEMKNNGFNTPKIVFFTHSKSLKVIKEVYADLYKDGLYKDHWYYLDNKPFIIGYTTPEADNAASSAEGFNGNYDARRYALTPEILNFFSFRTPQWPYDSYIHNGFPYIEWQYPQPMHDGVMVVSVSSHPAGPYSYSVTRGTKNWGRGYNVNTKQNVASDVAKGTFFDSQWATVKQQQPYVTLVTGWNEWVAQKIPNSDGEYTFYDTINQEFSRDIEMMKGGHNDAFYIQLIKNMRQFRANKVEGTVSSTQKSIDIFGDVSQWNSVNAYYKGTEQKSIARNYCWSGYTGQGDPLHMYTQDAARNNILSVKITRDANNFYFLIECQANITGSGANYMNLFIGTGELKQKGWNGYEYVINRKMNGNTSEIWKLDSSFNGTKVGQARVNVSGKYMQLEIPRSAIGMQNSNNLYFKVADNISNPSDIMDYYVSGKSFPVGRLSYRYLG